jgi:hypothetical protein
MQRGVSLNRSTSAGVIGFSRPSGIGCRGSRIKWGWIFP